MPNDVSMPDRLAAVRRFMANASVDVLLVRSTDRYLNEYVPNDESTRVWVSGFTGSMGEVVVTADAAYLIVDGRYWLQAEQETDADQWTVIKVEMGQGIEQAVIDCVKAARKEEPIRIGFEPDRLTIRGLERLTEGVGTPGDWVPLSPSPVERAMGPEPLPKPAGLRLVDSALTGSGVEDKLARLADVLSKNNLDGLAVQRLDDIAYLSNLRGTALPYQATFKGLALVTAKTLYVGFEGRIPKAVREACPPAIQLIPQGALFPLLTKKVGGRKQRIGVDPDHNTEHVRHMIEQHKAEAVSVESPLADMKAHKNEAELASMKDAFRRADTVVAQAIRWVCKEVSSGRKVTERDFADEVSSLFTRYGATGLSFPIIAAAGKNGAIIHYSDPSPRRRLKRGELMLLDTGGYFEAGYATDLTRTFLLDDGKAKGTDEQRRLYTLVLKGAIAGMRAVFPEGTTGEQLDAIIRAPMWSEGLNYNHGTGHGVGINVHEYPPRVAPGARTPLEPGYVFSIEPGLYLPRFGGIRIENLCTVEPMPKKKGFLRVVPLTFSPLDKRLMDTSRLNADEKAWLKGYGAEYAPYPLSS